MEELEFENAAAILKKVTGYSGIKKKDDEYIIYLTSVHECMVDVIVDEVEGFKQNFPDIYDLLNIEILDNGTTDFVNAIMLKIVLTFKENIDQYRLKALLKIKGIL